MAVSAAELLINPWESFLRRPPSLGSGDGASPRDLLS
jgi:hypothetical protein